MPEALAAIRSRLSRLSRWHGRSSAAWTAHLEPPSYAARHAGATFLVLGAGPTLARYGPALRELIARERPIVLGPNNITPFLHPDYHAFTNKKAWVEYASTIDSGRSRVLVGPAFPRSYIRARYGGPYERIMYRADNAASFDIEDGIVLAGCRTSSVLLIGVAIVMGAGRVYVAGLDGYRILADHDRPLDPDSARFTPTRVWERRPEEYDRIDAYQQRFLDEIQQYLSRQQREHFRIITPTTYSQHYDGDVLGLKP